MEKALNDLETLFSEAKQKNEFDFILTLINYKGMGARKLTTNLYEWIEAVSFYESLYQNLSGKEKTRMGLLLYSTFFENSDFYNIIGSLCKIKLGYKPSSYLFWKTKKYERLLGVGEKRDFLSELLDDAGKPNIVSFFDDNHFKEIRNAFFHSAYALDDKELIIHDSDPILINGVGNYSVEIDTFLYRKIDNVIAFFEVFKRLYLDSFISYQSDKEIDARFPNRCKATILGSKEGLRGFVIKNSVSFYDKPHDSGIWYDEKYDMWSGKNIRIDFPNIESIEIDEALTRYEGKTEIKRHNAEFKNVIDKIVERQNSSEIGRAVNLLLKFGDDFRQKMLQEKNGYLQLGFAKKILPYYRKAVEIGDQILDLSRIKKEIGTLEEFVNGK